MATQLLLAYGVVLTLGVYIVRSLVAGRQARLPLPPGPKGLPLVGNIFELPPPGIPEWRHWLGHKNRYGPLSSVTVLGQTIILVHDKDMATDLFEKQVINCSSRPWMTFSSELCGYGRSLSFLPYNKALREQRKLVASQIGSNTALEKFGPFIDLEVRRFLLRNMDNSEDLVPFLKTMTATIMLETLYGYTPSPHKVDPLVAQIGQVMNEFSEATAAGSWLVDLFPILRYVPEWVPGAEFKRTAKAWNKSHLYTISAPFEFVKHQMANHMAKPSFVAGLLGSPDHSIPPGELDKIKLAASSLYGGGSDTTVAVLTVFFLAMTLSPEVQRKAHEEIDRVVGTHQLPSFEDIKKLPYIQAVVKETLRWHPIAPLSLPRIAEEDGEYRGYRIPKGAILLPALGWFSQNPALYHEPESFRPERHLGPNKEPDPSVYLFGFGRRICPGRLLADSVLSLTIARSLAVFVVKKGIDEHGAEVEPRLGGTSGVVRHPLPFRYRLVPRSEKHGELVRSVEITHPLEEGDAKFIEDLGDRDWPALV